MLHVVVPVSSLFVKRAKHVRVSILPLIILDVTADMKIMITLMKSGYRTNYSVLVKHLPAFHMVLPRPAALFNVQLLITATVDHGCHGPD